MGGAMAWVFVNSTVAVGLGCIMQSAEVLMKRKR